MQLSTCLFTNDPGKMTVIEPDLTISYVRTYTNVAIFSWGSTIVGKELELGWNAMPVVQYEVIRGYKDAATTITFYPTNTASTSNYRVRILNFTGAYIQSFGISTSTSAWRGDCSLSLLVEATIST